MHKIFVCFDFLMYEKINSFHYHLIFVQYFQCSENYSIPQYILLMLLLTSPKVIIMVHFPYSTSYENLFLFVLVIDKRV